MLVFSIGCFTSYFIAFTQLIIVVILLYYFFLSGHRFTFYRERYLVKIPPILMDNSFYIPHSNADSIGKQIKPPKSVGGSVAEPVQTLSVTKGKGDRRKTEDGRPNTGVSRKS